MEGGLPGPLRLEGVPWDTVPLVNIEDNSGNAQECVMTPSLGVDSESGAGLLWHIKTKPDEIRATVMGAKLKMMVPMLNDETRNQAYEDAISHAIQRFKDQHDGRAPKVLDIGSGTGLLSLLAAKHGAKQVVSCEMNPILANITAEEAKANNFESCITVLGQRSSDVQLEPGQSKFDIIITETLDSDLLNEGIAQNLLDERARLGTPECQVIPNRASVFVQIYGCPEGSFAHINPCEFALDSNGILRAYERVTNLAFPIDRECLDDTHPGRIPGIRALSTVGELYNVNFMGNSKDSSHWSNAQFSCCVDSIVQEEEEEDKEHVGAFILVWWKTWLFPHQAGEAKRQKMEQPLSTCPNIKEDNPRWQNHWFPLVVPLNRRMKMRPGKIELQFHLLESQLSLDNIRYCGAATTVPPPTPTPTTNRVPNSVYDRRRSAELACIERHQRFQQVLENALTDPNTVVVDVSDGARCAALVAGFCIKETAFASNVTQVLARSSEGESACQEEHFWASVTKNKIRFSKDPFGFVEKTAHSKVLIASDLYYKATLNNPVLSAMLFHKQAQWISNGPEKDRKFENVSYVPQEIHIMGAIVSFPRLVQVLTPPISIAGFDHRVSAETWGALTEMIPLSPWCYRHTVCSEARVLATIRGDHIESIQTCVLKRRNDQTAEDQTDALAFVVWIDHAGISCPTLDSMKWHDRCLFRKLDKTKATRATVLDSLTIDIEHKKEGFHAKIFT